ncbi:MAG: flavodoxin-dependent (E)-4-hydroxy-3-methylbut-2-enyl-diphosphate synthase [Lachnospiraceae bacterium]|nr:flavodoxin-dependent (E)-4-hydroxy-3-methylbut-2-enyl-diphosphate synthase [Lachnospiraceae bacterium]
MERRISRTVAVGDVLLGGGSPIAVQSMTNTRTEDAAATAAQIRRLEEAGCEIVRVTVPTPEAARALREIRRRIRIPLVADIHFDWRLAVSAMENGADKIRINPGNIGGPDRVREVTRCAAERGIPIRVGVNSGSLEKDLLEKYGGVTAGGLAESALRAAAQIEDAGYDRIVISMKSTRVPLCIEAHRILAGKTDYPLHVGITESGSPGYGTVKSAAGIGAILAMGIGDTIRVSLTGDPVEEVRVARQLLRSLELRNDGVEVVSCPTCGRTRIDLVSLVKQVEELTENCPKTLRVAVMGCVVNGPGEAREADLGIAGGDGEGLLFRKGKILRRVPEAQLLEAFREELSRL